MKELNLAIEMLLIYLQGIWLRRRYIILTAWIVCPVGWLVVFNLPPTYQADAKLYVETRSVLDPILQGLAFQGNPEQQIEIMAKTLLSRPNLEKIARATDLDVQATDKQAYENIIDGLKKDIKFSSSGRENIYVISYANASSALALKVVQETLNAFVENQVGTAAQDSKKANEFLEVQIRDYENRLSEAEKRLSDFKKEQMMIAPNSEQNFYARIEAEAERLEQAQLDLRQLQSQLDSARRQLQGEDFTLSDGDVGISGFTTQYDERIKTLQTQLDGFLIRFTDSHPDVIETRRTLENLQKLKKQEILSIQAAASKSSSASSGLSQNQVYQELRLNASKLENEVESAKVRVKNFQDKLDALERQRNIIPDIEAKFSGLNRDYEVTKQKYEELLTRREAMELSNAAAKSEQDVQFKIIDPPRVPFKPSGPPRVVLYTVVLVLGAIAGIFMAFARSQLQPVVTSALQLKTIADFPVFGLVSHTNKDALIRQNKKHLLYFIALASILLFGFVLLVTNELVFGLTATELMGRLL